MKEFVLINVAGCNWPGSLPWRGIESPKGYRTREEAAARAEKINRHYNATHGQGIELRVYFRDDGK